MTSASLALALGGIGLSSAQAQQTVVTGLPESMATQGIAFDKKPTMPAVLPPASRSSEAPLTMEAESMAYDQKNGIVMASGKVMVEQGGSLLSADRLTYYQNQNIVLVDGNVSILQPTGEVFFAEHAELKDDMKRAVIRHFKARMSDDSVFAAHAARRVKPGMTVMKKGVYTPCNLCEDMEPFWQIKADQMKIDELEESIVYRHARMEMKGIPIFYAPYLSQPTPEARAKSGLLTPKYSSGHSFGETIKLPYYWRIAEDQEMTLTPWIMSDENPLLDGEYHQVTDGGNYDFLFSGTEPQRRDAEGNPISGTQFRGHIYAKGNESLGDYSSVGFDVNRATDDTYLRRYGFGSQATLFSRAYIESQQQRNYAQMQSVAIQGLRATDDPSTTPLILPTIASYYETEPNAQGLRFYSAANAQSLTRELGADQQRLSTTLGANAPYITSDGQVLTATLNLRQDVYKVAHVSVPGVTDEVDGTYARTIPQAALEWRYPLIRAMRHAAMTVEPVVVAVTQPNGGNPVEIPNEDNKLIELSDTNIFSIHRMPGLDTVDNGSRIAYGMRTQYLFEDGTTMDALLGQTYSSNAQTPFPNSNTVGERSSDYIGRIGVTAWPVRFDYRFAMDRDTLDANRSEWSAQFSKPWLNTALSYRSIVNNRYVSDSKEATLYADTPLSDAWKIYGSGRRDLVVNQMIAANTGLVYHNECFNIIFEGLRTYTRDRDIAPDTQYTVQVAFKNLGEFGE